jgi:hypothetical protein
VNDDEATHSVHPRSSWSAWWHKLLDWWVDHNPRCPSWCTVWSAGYIMKKMGRE